MNEWAGQRVAAGVEKARVGDHKGAIEDYDLAIALKPDHVDGLVARGASKVNLGQINAGVVDLERAANLDPSHRNAKPYLDRTLAKFGVKRDEAEKKPVGELMSKATLSHRDSKEGKQGVAVGQPAVSKDSAHHQLIFDSETFEDPIQATKRRRDSSRRSKHKRHRRSRNRSSSSSSSSSPSPPADRQDVVNRSRTIKQGANTQGGIADSSVSSKPLPPYIGDASPSDLSRIVQKIWNETSTPSTSSESDSSSSPARSRKRSRKKSKKSSRRRKKSSSRGKGRSSSKKRR
eukprot:GHVN01003952.1.p1 GENE.GHVN01003952.1~~GHVN01003952.1.p1  ORF type:complete len:290 (-),score=43.62 GHVN01003952.1:15-884(-)